MLVLVTGGTGFLGKSLIKLLLQEGIKVRALTRRKGTYLDGLGVEPTYGDLANFYDLEALDAATSGVDAVIHSAAKTGVWGELSPYVEANTLGTMRLLSAALANKVRIFIYTSTPSVIFNAKGHEGPDETAPLTFDPKYPYPFSKAVAEMAVLSANGKAIRTLALRPHLIWGPGDPHFTPRILTLAKKGKLRLFSGGPYLIDATFIDNAAAAHLAALKVLSGGGDAASDAAGRAYFIGQGETISILDFMNRFLKAANYYPVTAKIPPFAGRFLARATEFFWKCFRLKGEPPITLFSAIELSTSHYFDIGNAKRYLGYTPKVSYEEGFRILSKYFKEGCPFEES